MAVKLVDNFSYNGKKPLDARIVVNSISDLVGLNPNTIYDGILVFSADTKKFYVYNSGNSIDPQLDKWRELTAAGYTIQNAIIDDVIGSPTENHLILTLNDDPVNPTKIDCGNAIGPKGDKGEGFAIVKLYTSIIEMVSDINPVQDGQMVAVIDTSTATMSALVYIRNSVQIKDTDNENGYTYFCNLADATTIQGPRGKDGRIGFTPVIHVTTVPATSTTPEGKKIIFTFGPGHITEELGVVNTTGTHQTSLLNITAGSVEVKDSTNSYTDDSNGSLIDSLGSIVGTINYTSGLLNFTNVTLINGELVYSYNNTTDYTIYNGQEITSATVRSSDNHLILDKTDGTSLDAGDVLGNLSADLLKKSDMNKLYGIDVLISGTLAGIVKSYNDYMNGFPSTGFVSKGTLDNVIQALNINRISAKADNIITMEPDGLYAVGGGGHQGPSLPVGGRAGEYLVKQSDTDGDADWQIMPGVHNSHIGDIVESIAENAPAGALPTGSVFTEDEAPELYPMLPALTLDESGTQSWLDHFRITENYWASEQASAVTNKSNNGVAVSNNGFVEYCTINDRMEVEGHGRVNSAFNAGYDFWAMFTYDKGASGSGWTKWNGSTHKDGSAYVEFSYNDGAEYAPFMLALECYNASSTYTITKARLQGFDGTNWVDLLTTNRTISTKVLYFIIPGYDKDITYSRFRCYFTCGGSGGSALCSQFYLYGTEKGQPSWDKYKEIPEVSSPAGTHTYVVATKGKENGIVAKAEYNTNIDYAEFYPGTKVIATYRNSTNDSIINPDGTITLPEDGSYLLQVDDLHVDSGIDHTTRATVFDANGKQITNNQFTTATNMVCPGITSVLNGKKGSQFTVQIEQSVHMFDCTYSTPYTEHGISLFRLDALSKEYTTRGAAAAGTGNTNIETLIGCFDIEPVTFMTGEKYYNKTDGLIYTALNPQTWDTGKQPQENTIYVSLVDKDIFIYERVHGWRSYGGNPVSKREGNAIEIIENALDDAEDGIYVKDLTPEIAELNALRAKKFANIDTEYLYLYEDDYSAPTYNVKMDDNLFEMFPKHIGNIEFTDDRYIKLKAGIKYRITCSFLFGYTYKTSGSGTSLTAEAREVAYCLYDDKGNKVNWTQNWDGISQGAKGLAGTFYTGNPLDVIYEPTEDIKICAKVEHLQDTNNRNVETWGCNSSVIVQEIGKAVEIDPVNYVNETTGIEDSPVGQLITYPGTTNLKHYLLCDGKEYNIKDYPYLAQFFKEEYGKINIYGGDGINTFRVPDTATNVLTNLIKDVKTDGEAFTNIGTYTSSPGDHVNVFDLGSNIAGWFSNSNPDIFPVSSEPHIGWKFDSPKRVTGVQISNYAYQGKAPYRLTDFAIQGSNDGIAWDTLLTSKQPENTNLIDYEIVEPGYYTRYRLLFTGPITAGSNYNWGVGKISFFGTSLTNDYIKYEPTYFMELNQDAYVSQYYENYDTNEKIIGKWINGKPIYRKTILAFVSGAAANKAITLTNLSLLTVDTLVDVKGYAHKAGEVTQYPIGSGSSTGSIRVFRNVDNDLREVHTDAGINSLPLVITLEYTKTTDIPNSFTPDMIIQQFTTEELLEVPVTDEEVDACFGIGG